MSKPQNFAELLAHDKRYKREAYGFVFEGLRYAHEVMGLGTSTPSEEREPTAEAPAEGPSVKDPAVKDPTVKDPVSKGSSAGKPAGKSARKPPAGAPEPTPAAGEAEPDPPRHLTGRELCEAIRRYALDQFGFMAKTVLNTWGVHNTGDFGNIVFNLIDIGEMSKTKDDRREDFDDVFDFETDLQGQFRIELPKSSG
jgi:uncharacterized repeat protein (TIGR04138 family)